MLMQNLEWIVAYALLGSFVGFMGGLLGVGGGGILVPLLTSIFIQQGVSSDRVMHLALGTSLASMIISSLSSSRAHIRRGNVVWSMVSALAPGILLGAFVVSRLAIRVNSAYIAVFFSVFMALIAGQMFLDWKPRRNPAPSSSGTIFIVGTVIGAVSALAAVGGGILSVMYLSFKNVDMKRAVGTSAAIGLPIAVAGTLGYLINGWSKTSNDPFTLGFVYVPAFIIISAASALAAPYGVRYSYNLPDARLKRIFAILSLILSVRMLFQLFGSPGN